MSILRPLFGVDLSDNNPAVSLRTLEEQGYDFCILRVTGGFGGGGDVYMDADYKVRHSQLVKRNMVGGVYGFPVSPHAVDMDRQIDRFVNSVIGGFDGKLICIDYELYGPSPALTITPAALRAYVQGIRKAIGPRHPIGMYAGRSFWIEPPASGELSYYDRNMWRWVPKYWTIDAVDKPRRHYLQKLPLMRYWQKFPGEEHPPLMTQPCIGKAGGGIVDIDAFRGDRQKLLSLTRG